MLRRVILQDILWVGGLWPVGLRLIGRRAKEATMKIEQAVAAGSAVGEVSFNALIVQLLIVNFQIANFQIVNLLIMNALIVNLPIVNALIISFLIIAALMICALMLVTLGRLRSRTGSSIPIVFNLSTAQMLRLFCHWSHISLI